MAEPSERDPELEALFAGEPELEALANRLRDVRAEPRLDPRFPSVLRAQLMREAAARVPAASRGPRRRSTSRRWWEMPSPFAWTGAGVGVALVAAAALVITNTRVQDHSVRAMSPVALLHAVSPNNVITVAFSQPMDETAVVAGLHIRPATEVTTAWAGNNLLITPTHHLSGNTPYTVTIDRSAARSASGQLAPAAITISFGTAPTPPATSAAPTLNPAALGPVDTSAAIIAGPRGSIIATSAPSGSPSPVITAPPSASPSSSPSSPAAKGTPTAAATSPSPSPSGSPAATANGTPASGSQLAVVSPGGTTTALGPAAESAALSPNGREVVAAVPAGSDVHVLLAAANGGSHTSLATVTAPVLAVGWLDATTTLVAEPDRVLSVDLQGHVATVATLPAGTTSAVFAPGGATVFAGSGSADGHLVDLSGGGAGRALPGSRTAVTFSGDGSTVAWVAAGGTEPQLMVSPVSHEAAGTIPLAHPGDQVSDLALTTTGTEVAFIDHAASGAELDLESLPSGSLIARGPAASHLVFLSNGAIGMVTASGEAATASIPGAPNGTQVNVLPDGAAGTLQAFVDAQVASDHSPLQALSAASVNAARVTPGGLTRSYVISAAANADGSVSAIARLIVDPSTSHPLASFANETLTLGPGPSGGGYVVTALSVGALTDEPIGPHVLHVVPSVSSGHLSLQVSFDSDLAVATVAPAIHVTTADGSSLTATTTYDPDTRTATVALDVGPRTGVTVTVATSLLDVDGQALAQQFTTATGG